MACLETTSRSIWIVLLICVVKLLALSPVSPSTCHRINVGMERGHYHHPLVVVSSSRIPPATLNVIAPDFDEEERFYHRDRQRRTFLSFFILLPSTLLTTSFALVSPAFAQQQLQQQSPSSQPDAVVPLEMGTWLERRVQSNTISPPSYGMEGTDIFYPSWFAGTWQVSSTTQDVQAPLGVALFGGNVTYQTAKQDVGNVLNYQCRFITSADSSRTISSSSSTGRGDISTMNVIADRDFNVRSIATVALGENSVVDVSTATPNKFSCLILAPSSSSSPVGSPSLMSVDMLVLNRKQESMGPYHFDCSEVVREIVIPVDRQRQQQPSSTSSTLSSAIPLLPLMKEIETTSLYTYLPDKDEIHCRQRSAAYLLPSNQNQVAMKLWQRSGGQAIDVRFYDVTYTRKN
jgi:hypothetical protein